MGLLEFIASIVKSCAWPFVVGFVVYLFRKEIKPLLPYARLRLKHNDTEVDFRLELRCGPNLQRCLMDGESDDQSKTEHGQQVLRDL